jgi:Co/Zn/Cd efflux system component
VSASCCSGGCAGPQTEVPPSYKRALWIALFANLAMFAIEIISGWNAQSVSLLADAVDFMGDAMNYGLSLFALTLAAVWRSRTALAKGLTMGAYGLIVLGQAIWHLFYATIPDAAVMGWISLLALVTNGSVAVMLYAYRTGDANMRSVWLCSRNDAIGNLAVMLAAAGVFGSGAGWPDAVVAIGMAGLGLSAAISVVRQARMELRPINLRVSAAAGSGA